MYLKKLRITYLNTMVSNLRTKVLLERQREITGLLWDILKFQKKHDNIQHLSDARSANSS